MGSHYTRLAGYSSATVVEATGLTYRQLDYWVRVGLVTPSYAKAVGSGSARDWSDEDVAKLCLGKVAVDSGASLDSVRELFATIDSLPDASATQDLFLLLPQGGTPELVDVDSLAARLRRLRTLVRVLYLRGLDEPLTLVGAEG